MITIVIFNLWFRGNENDEENVDQIADEDTEVKLERDRVAEYFTNRFFYFLFTSSTERLLAPFHPHYPQMIPQQRVVITYITSLGTVMSNIHPLCKVFTKKIDTITVKFCDF